MRLEEAVATAVNELKSKGMFSAYDITTFIRNKSNAGEIDLPGLEARPNNQNIKFWINHEDVKSLLNELFASGELENLGLTDRTFNGTYLEYRFDNNTVTVSVTPPTVASVTNANNVGNNWGAPSPVKPISIEARIYDYLSNNLRPSLTTLKDIQSALKTNGVTCADIYNYLTNYHLPYFRN